MRNRFIQTLLSCAMEDRRIFLMSIDLGYSVLEEYAQKLPKQFLNVGIQEQNAIGFAAGLALSGHIVYVYSIVPFVTMRCFEQIRVDLAYMNTNVRLAGVGAGLSYGALGATHHAMEDIAVMRALPNMTVLCPGDPYETEQLTRQSVCHSGPIYLRLGKGKDPSVHSESDPIQIGKASVLRTGTDVNLLTTSNMLPSVVELASRLETEKITANVVSFHTVKPLDIEAVITFLKKGIPTFVIEEHSVIGGLGSAVAEIVAESGLHCVFKRLGIPDAYLHQVGSQNFLRQQIGLDVIQLKARILELL